MQKFFIKNACIIKIKLCTFAAASGDRWLLKKVGWGEEFESKERRRLKRLSFSFSFRRGVESQGWLKEFWE